MTEDEMGGWHHRPNGHEFKQIQMVKDREAWHTVAKSRTRLSDQTTLICSEPVYVASNKNNCLIFFLALQSLYSRREYGNTSTTKC